MIGEWEGVFTLTTPEGSLTLNDTDGSTGQRFQLVPARCSAGLPVRVTDDDMPQKDGAIPHRRWRSGYTVHLAIEPLVESAGEFACADGADIVAMLDELGLHLNSMIRTGLVGGFPNARLSWVPSGSIDCRMFDRLQLLSAPTVTLDGELGGVLIEVDFSTAYPYYISCTEHDYSLSDTGLNIVTNAGNTDYYPLILVYGNSSAFTIYNESITDYDGNPLRIEYDDALPGAVTLNSPDYIEFNNFLGTAFLNGDQDNMLAGVNMLTSEFFPLIPGDNEIFIIGATAIVKANDSWA